jgi:aspartyl/asparaginyl-tRNA synthetase
VLPPLPRSDGPPQLNDGSCLKGLQVVAGADLPSYGEVDRLTTGASVAVRGVVAESPGKGQRFEVKAAEVSKSSTLLIEVALNTEERPVAGHSAT